MTFETFTGVVESIAFGGNGVIRHQGKVVFVPFTMPGERVSFQIIQDKKNFAFGRLEAILESNPNRVKPPCPYFGVCGGCQLQHMDYPSQLEAKRKAVEDALLRIGKVSLPGPIKIIPADPIWHYRRHVQLHLRIHNKICEVGYIANDQVSFVPVKQCAIFIETKVPFFSHLEALLRPLAENEGQSGRLKAFKAEDGKFVLDIHLQKPVPAAIKSHLEMELQRIAIWQGILFSDPKQQLTIGNPDLVWKWNGKELKMSARAFAQNHPEQSAAITQSLVDWAKRSSASRVLDLYCGIGLTSVVLQQEGLQVWGIESSEEAVHCARLNAPGVRFIVARVEDVLEDVLQELKPEAIILNPPRAGLDEKVVRGIMKNRSIQKIAYVSCMPSTLARDLKDLSPEFVLEECVAYDMFPQTAHVETVSWISRS